QRMELLDRLADRNRLERRELAVDLQDEVDVFTDGLARRRDPVDHLSDQGRQRQILIARWNRIELDRGEALARCRPRVSVDLFGTTAGHQQVKADLVPTLPAEQVPDRRLKMLPFDVPERDVHRADR